MFRSVESNMNFSDAHTNKDTQHRDISLSHLHSLKPSFIKTRFVRAPFILSYLYFIETVPEFVSKMKAAPQG